MTYTKNSLFKISSIFTRFFYIFLYTSSQLLVALFIVNILRYAFKNIFRNIFLSVSSILIIGLLVFFVNILLFVIYSTDEFIHSINNRISININLQDGYDSSQIRSQDFFSGIRKNFTGAVAQYISREDAFDILKTRNPDLASLVEQNDQNPLPNSIRISNVAISSYRDLDIYISGFKDILQYDQSSFDKKLLDYRAQYERISSVVEMLKILQVAVYILLILFVFTVSIVVYMVIHNFIFFLRDEIRIIELVGGNPSFIYGPFVLQGLLYSMIASMIAIAATIGSLKIIIPHQAFIELTGFLQNFSLIFSQYVWIIIAIFACIGAVSAFLASWGYIHSTIGE